MTRTQHNRRFDVNSGKNNLCPHSIRVERTEKIVESLAKDVGQLVKAQQGLVDLYKQQAAQAVENRHTSETFSRLFQKVEGNEKALMLLRGEIAEIRSRANMLGVLVRYWPLFFGVSLAVYAGAAMLQKSGLFGAL